jgi:hypothetical protein
MNKIDSSLHAIHRAGRRLFAWALACCVIACGCVFSPPSHIQLLAPNQPIVDSRKTDTPAFLRDTTFNVWGLPSCLNGASSERFPEIARELVRLSDHMGMEALLTFRSASENNRPILIGQRAEAYPVESPF